MLMLISYLDRGNIGFAATQGMADDIGLVGNQLNVCALHPRVALLLTLSRPPSQSSTFCEYYSPERDQYPCNCLGLPHILQEMLLTLSDIQLHPCRVSHTHHSSSSSTDTFRFPTSVFVKRLQFNRVIPVITVRLACQLSLTLR
jgi:hypothetical protein